MTRISTIAAPMSTIGAEPTPMPSTTTPIPAAAQLLFIRSRSCRFGERHRRRVQNLVEHVLASGATQLAIQIEHEPMRYHRPDKVPNIVRQHERSSVDRRPRLADAIERDCASRGGAQPDVVVLARGANE